MNRESISNFISRFCISVIKSTISVSFCIVLNNGELFLGPRYIKSHLHRCIGGLLHRLIGYPPIKVWYKATWPYWIYIESPGYKKVQLWLVNVYVRQAGQKLQCHNFLNSSPRNSSFPLLKYLKVFLQISKVIIYNWKWSAPYTGTPIQRFIRYNAVFSWTPNDFEKIALENIFLFQFTRCF